MGYANGLVRIFDSKEGFHLADLQAHSRAVNAIAVRPGQPTFATVSDDTFVNEWTVDVERQSLSDIRLSQSLRVPDMLLVGVQYQGSNIVAAPYDFKFLVLI